ncbi:SDR family oxidoreductase [Biomaibacter acetigenes]|jgi:sorbitol-6-phosphate 2-dehydrogenase|uniref:SDR family oxidoreductase n=1 Tax=Biomaibacter acetigenes TaxID=2316383 RepID=A0A3G2R3U7_9FIRM|nr:SDR family oxidoreductase [Biomaibacter acetigenes]AYO30143.1 SDR family oxidoreductase [Biomaibacter acetigenes]MDN5311996.1 sorbitol-6-phosphate 2-dehydrogenase [Thermoanaerobacteraceae bacterium]
MEKSWLNLEGKVAIVTGGASGIGKAVAQKMAEQGMNVVISDVNPAGQEVLKELCGGPQKHLFIMTDVTKAESVENMVQKTIEKYGKLDVLVNNAGVNLPRLLVDPKDPKGKFELKEKEFDLMVAINQKGAFLCAQAAAREMVKRNSGVIINMSSESGLEGSEGQSCYAATKAALYSLTRSWAKELGKYGVRVVALAPGILEKTALRTEAYEEALAYTRGITVEQLRKSYEKVSIPLGRVGRLSEVADLVCFLASDRASYIHGVTYNITGGKSRG